MSFALGTIAFSFLIIPQFSNSCIGKWCFRADFVADQLLHANKNAALKIREETGET